MNHPGPDPGAGPPAPADERGDVRADPPDLRAGTPDARTVPRESAPVCERCGHPMLDRHCKVVCLNCGYQRDCSDP